MLIVRKPAHGILYYMGKREKKPAWQKRRGYLHIGPKLAPSNIQLLAFLKNKKKIARHNFYPLLHTTISERRYKRCEVEGEIFRAHSYLDEKGSVEHNKKDRPLYYATHLDSAIYAYYADLLNKKYEERLKDTPLSDCITA